MPTRSIRDYGPIGAGNAAQDNATFKKAVAASKAGDTLTMPYDAVGRTRPPRHQYEAVGRRHAGHG